MGQEQANRDEMRGDLGLVRRSEALLDARVIRRAHVSHVVANSRRIVRAHVPLVAVSYHTVYRITLYPYLQYLLGRVKGVIGSQPYEPQILQR